MAEIGAIAQEADVYFHTDAVQAVGKLPIDVKAIGCDLLTISGHKFHGPQGTGALYIRRGTHPEPLIHGGPQERQRRAGTENLPGIVGLGHAAEMAVAFVESDGPARLAALRDRLEKGILSRVSAAGRHGGNAQRVPNTTNIWFDHLEGEALVIALDLKGLALSGGSACTSGAMDPSHVLKAMGVASARARREPALQPRYERNREGRRLCAGTGADRGGAPAGVVAVLPGDRESACAERDCRSRKLDLGIPVCNRWIL